MSTTRWVFLLVLAAFFVAGFVGGCVGPEQFFAPVVVPASSPSWPGPPCPRWVADDCWAGYACVLDERGYAELLLSLGQDPEVAPAWSGPGSYEVWVPATAGHAVQTWSQP